MKRMKKLLTGLLTLAMTVVWFNIDRLGQPEELLPLIRPYFLLQLASLVFVMLFNSFKQFADGITDTKTPMYIMISANLVNIAGNYILMCYGKKTFWIRLCMNNGILHMEVS